MNIYGREVNFLRTVEATIKIADMCPDSDIEKADQLFDGSYQVSQQTAATFMAVLSEGYETNKAFADPDYKPHPLTEREALSLQSEDFSALFGEAIQAYTGEKVTVEAEPVKKTDEIKDKKSNSTEHGSSSTAES